MCLKTRHAKFSLVLRCIRSIGGRPLESATGSCHRLIKRVTFYWAIVYVVHVGLCARRTFMRLASVFYVKLRHEFMCKKKIAFYVWGQDVASRNHAVALYWTVKWKSNGTGVDVSDSPAPFRKLYRWKWLF